MLLNDDIPTYLNGERNLSSILDLSFVNSSLGLNTSWHVNQDSWGSDHFPIFIRINAKVTYKPKTNRKYRLYSSKTDREKFSISLTQEIDNFSATILTISDTQTMYTTFVSLITDNLRKASAQNPSSSSPCKYPVINLKNITKPSSDKKENSNYLKNKTSRVPCPWWNKECDNLIENRNKALVQFKACKTRTNFLSYKREVAKTRIGLRNIKKNSFVEFCENLRKDSNPTYVWKKIKAFKNRFNHFETKNEYKPEVIKNIYQQISSLFPPGTASPPVSLPEENYYQSLDCPFTYAELEYTFKLLRKNSSPGLDGIDYTIIVALPTNAKSLLLNILNRIFITHTFPDEWRKYLVFFIPKQDDTKFRPISLASCIFKILERLIANRLNWFLEHYNLLPNSQFGFRRNRGCIDNLAILHSNILLGFQDDSSTLVLKRLMIMLSQISF